LILHPHDPHPLRHNGFAGPAHPRQPVSKNGCIL
jgi:hypothetical protein